jgi:hypothetical protein
MAITTKQIAEHFGFSPSRASALIREGMPLTSIEDATAWRDARILRGKQGRQIEPSNIVLPEGSVIPDADFEQTVDKHRQLKESARLRYVYARDHGLPEESKLYITYEKILRMMVVVERESKAREIESGQLIRLTNALEKMGKILTEIKSDCLGMGIEIAPMANPDSPGTALKVIDEKMHKNLLKWSQAEKEMLSVLAEPKSEPMPTDNLNDAVVDETDEPND